MCVQRRPKLHWAVLLHWPIIDSPDNEQKRSRPDSADARANMAFAVHKHYKGLFSLCGSLNVTYLMCSSQFCFQVHKTAQSDQVHTKPEFLIPTCIERKWDLTHACIPSAKLYLANSVDPV